jgi:bifunctional DNA-binding transcriptional regulator/antitoxin component of YhaV-PrlF toxin-antitoxin module
MTSAAIVIRACPDGPLRMPRRACIVIPRPARTLHRIEAGDHVLLAAAPEYQVVIVHSLSALDDMLTAYHSTSAHSTSATGIPRT